MTNYNSILESIINFGVPFLLGIPVGFAIGYKFFKWMEKQPEQQIEYPPNYRALNKDYG